MSPQKISKTKVDFKGKSRVMVYFLLRMVFFLFLLRSLGMSHLHHYHPCQTDGVAYRNIGTINIPPMNKV